MQTMIEREYQSCYMAIKVEHSNVYVIIQTTVAPVRKAHAVTNPNK